MTVDNIKPLILNKKVMGTQIYETSRYNSSILVGLDEFTKSINKTPTEVVKISCKGKFIYWKFSNDFYLMNTMGMTGQWSPRMGKHPSFEMLFNDNTSIYFNDPRHFGTIKFSNNKSDLVDKLNELGWDPLNNPFDVKYQNYMVNKILSKKKCIGEVLMDQSVFAGVGNYIRAEALYLSNISPWRICKQLSRDEVLTLCNNLIHVMNESYSYQGATILTYKDAYGAEGRYSSCFKVYGQSKDPLGNKIITETTPEGRTIHWCPTVQK